MKRRAVAIGLPLAGLFLAGLPGGPGSVAGQTEQRSSQEQISRGAFLVNIGGCHHCHTPKTVTARGPVPDETRSLMGAPADTKVAPIPPGVLSPAGWGALATHDLTTWAGPWGVSFASNLTPDKATGLGSWTEAAFIKSMRTGKHKGVLREILPPMPWQDIGKLGDNDLKAVFAYLKTLKPIQNKVPDPIPPKK